MITDKLLELVKNFEGFEAHAFEDYDQFSIGYGSVAKSPDEVITEEEATKRLTDELQDAQNELLPALAKKNWSLNENQLDALTSFTYNTGRGVYVINESKTIDEMPSHMIQYVKAGGETLQGLVDRRKAEVECFNSSV